VDLLARINYADVHHQMDNFRLRTPPAMAMRWRLVDAKAETLGYALSGALDLFTGRLSFGFDGHAAVHDVDISNPNDPAFFATTFNAAERNLFGFFGEWKGSPAERWDLTLGLRYTRVDADAGRVDALPAQMPDTAPARLRDGFNASQRDRSDNLFDYVIKAGFAPAEGWRIELGTARKTRAPSYIERYLWAPMQSTGGLADGRNYVGNVGLEPEKSYEVEGGVEWRWSRFWVAPRAFYRWIDDYIQGTPSTDPDVIAMSSMNGDPNPLEFSNVEAELYGIDALYGVQLPCDFQLDGVVSYVRAKRTDTRDDLYRIAPLRGRTTLRYVSETWSVSLEGVYAAEQNKVAKTNAEPTSESWGIMNLFGSWEPVEGVVLEFGIDNLLDDVQRDHLAGISRVTSSGVTAGQRLPGPRRSFYGRITGRF
jgi:iron complex outermembrane receptor protein